MSIGADCFDSWLIWYKPKPTCIVLHEHAGAHVLLPSSLIFYVNKTSRLFYITAARLGTMGFKVSIFLNCILKWVPSNVNRS